MAIDADGNVNTHQLFHASISLDEQSLCHWPWKSIFSIASITTYALQAFLLKINIDRIHRLICLFCRLIKLMFNCKLNLCAKLKEKSKKNKMTVVHATRCKMVFF